ncbi:hypothetical protein DXG01_013534 [Tephrocybe rancida]|nr:hypothetical protein DXG01_013534 [Tephrocybe rancida]
MVEAPPELQEEPKQNGELKGEAEVEKVADGPKMNGSNTLTTNGDATHEKRPRTHSDPDAQQMVITSLRSQVQDLFSQVNELNNKLVKSYDRVSDLEDDLHMASASNRTSSLKISQLELERTQHLSALNTGLLVEKSHVTAELNRLMEKATEEAAQRGQAESARQDIEKDLDDLSATLFGQANTMVAEARFAQHLSEQKVGVAERALKGAEEAVGVMQQQMQALQAEKEEAEKKAEVSMAAMDMSIGKGFGKRSSGNLARSVRLLSSHPPYQEFLLFVAHLRSVHPSSPQPPAMTTLLPLPFLARLLTEDSEPTIRLDLAPSLNWLSRRSVLAAIHNGQLIIEPMSSSALLQEINSPGVTGSSSNISCALCGSSIFSPGATHSHPLPPILAQSNSGSTSWSASLFKKPVTNYSVSTNNSTPLTPPARQSTFSQLSPAQVYIFRLATPSATTSSIPIPSLPRASTSSTSSSSTPQQSNSTDNHSSYTASGTPQSSTIYPLCTNNWCLSRLRMTCTLWAFVRAGIIEKIWEEEVPTLPTTAASPVGEKPPIPPRRRGIWGMASALGERATSWGEGDKDKSKKAAAASPTPTPTPPPKHGDRARRLPPPLPASTAAAKDAIPPPLPKRSNVRQASLANETAAATGTSTDAASSTDSVSTPVLKEPKLPLRPPRRPITPASVPLPESRPHTPPVAVAAAAGSPIPPPLPRRAAARSRLPVDSSTPSPPPPETTVEASTEAPDQKEQAASSVLAVEPSSESSVPAEGKDAKEEVVSEVSASAVVSPSVEEDVFVDAESEHLAVTDKTEVPVKEVEAPEAGNKTEDTGDKEGEDKGDEKVPETIDEKGEDGVDEKEKEKSEEEKVEESAVEKVTEEKEVEKIEAKANEVEVEKASEEVAAVPEKQASNETEKEDVGAQDTSDADDRKESLDDDVSGTYVGDATWEERTWKEIVRLKEEMFWARIGGSKQ